MTLWESVKKQFIDVIEWTEDGDATLAFRYPMRDREIQYGGQLTVRESQAAVFVNEGRVADVFPAGLYKLTTRTIPVLTALMNWDKLFESPFKSDVYFLSTRLRLDQQWGTPNPVTIRDADFGAVRLRAFGNYSYRIADPRLFHAKVSGTLDRYAVEDLAGQLRTLVTAGITDLFGASKVPFLDLAGHQDALGEELRKRIAPVFAAIGLELASFVVENVSLPDELQKLLDERIGMNMIGDMKRFTQYNVGANIGTAMNAAAANPGGLAGLTAGLGAGLASGVAVGRVMTDGLTQSIGPAAVSSMAPGVAPSIASSSDTTAGEDIPDLIARLHELKTKGAITEAEFEAKKVELLAKIGK